MYYHVRITQKSTKKDEVKVDLTEEQMLQRVVVPYEQGESITISGKTITPNNIDRIRINRSKENAGEIIKQIKIEDRLSPIILLRGPSDEWRAADRAEDVTDQYIKGPPGYKRHLERGGKERLYFSEREYGTRPRRIEEITKEAWNGIVAAIDRRIDNGSFGHAYPLLCDDFEEPVIVGCNNRLFKQALIAEIPQISWPLNPNEIPPTPVVLDLLEFCYRVVAMPLQREYHAFYHHYHLEFRIKEGQKNFREEINRILARNELAYELDSSGHVQRLGPEISRQQLLAVPLFQTGDKELDELLESARRKYFSPDLEIRREALEKLWDAWERLKTIEIPGNKKASVKQLLNKTAPEPTIREVLDDEARVLTDIGNNFMIRHSEIGKVPLNRSEDIDYLFHRMFALILLILRTTNRLGKP
ncbi:hypothetical protein MTBGP_04230 [Moorella thermoacetica]|uniref:AbiJ-NTD4 domain-containing protein n=1 Tax=Neomoorella thermoacetica TaxID=1525 RepID=UPI0030D46C21